MADTSERFPGFQRVPEPEIVVEQPRRQSEAEIYIEAVEEHRRQAGSAYNNREAEAYKNRLQAAAALFENPDEMAKLATARYDLLPIADADLKAFEQRVDNDEDRLITAVFGVANIGEIDQEKYGKIVADPISLYVYARDRFVGMTATGIDPEGAHLVRSIQVKKALEISRNPFLLMKFGANHSDLGGNLMNDLDRSNELWGKWSKETAGHVENYLKVEKDCRVALKDGNFEQFAALKTKRLLSIKAIRGNPAAFLFLGERAAADQIRITGKVLSDLESVRGGTDLAGDERFVTRLTKFREQFEKKWNDGADDPVKLYGRINDEISKAEISGIGSGNIVMLERLSVEYAMKIAKSTDAVGRLIDAKPELRGKWGREVTEERERIGLGKAARQVADPEVETRAAEEGRVDREGRVTEDAKVSKDEANGPSFVATGRRQRHGLDGRNFEGSLGGHIFESMMGNKADLSAHVKAAEAVGAEHSVFLALPVQGAFSRKLSEQNSVLDKMEPEALKRMFHNTVEMRFKLSKSAEINTPAGKLNYDRLEMGRRAIVDVMATRKILKDDEIKQIVGETMSPMKSPEGKNREDKYRRDPGDYMERGEIAPRMAYLRSRAGRAGKKIAKTYGTVKDAHGYIGKHTDAVLKVFDQAMR